MPERVAAVGGEAIQGTDFGEGAEFRFIEEGSGFEIFQRCEWASGSLFEHLEQVFFANVADNAESEAHGIIALDSAEPIGTHGAYRANLLAMTFGVFDDCCRRIKSHRLVVQETRIKFRRVMRLQISAAVRQDRKADGVRFGKAVERK